jgi:Uma2 family endonuclease
MTQDEFFAWDGGGHVGKLELVDGYVRAMGVASAADSIIQGNVVTAINNHLRSTGLRCRAGTEAPVIPPLRQKLNARAPDVAVTCAPLTDSKVFENPILIVEVMSPSNEEATWETISALAALTSLKEILVVQSTSMEAHVFTREADGRWPSDPVVTTIGGTINLTCLDFNLPLDEVYRDTHLQSGPDGA